MLKKGRWKIIAIACLLLVTVGMTVFSVVRGSPEYALLTMAKDVKSTGLEGLKPHLTGDALMLVEKLDGAKNNKVLDAISSILDTDWFEEKLQDELTQIEWKLDDVERHAGRAEISLEFNYKGKLTGEAELDMLRENGQWKISGIDFFDFERP